MSVHAKYQSPSFSRCGLKVPGGVVGCSVVGCGVVWLRPILVFSLSLSQAEQYSSVIGYDIKQFLYFSFIYFVKDSWKSITN